MLQSSFSIPDLLSFQTDTQYDAVIGRYFLLYQPDPSKALTHAVALVRPGGIVCFHEMSFGSPARSFPETTLFGNMLTLIGDVFRRVGINPDMGLLLAKTFADSGLPRPTIQADVPIGGEAGSYLYGWGAETVKSLLPIIEKLGLSTALDIQIDTLALRMEEEAVRNHSELIGPIQFGAWIRK